MTNISNQVTKLNYGIIGCGMMGQEHIRNLKLFKEIAITGICEPDQKMADLAKTLAPQATLFSDIKSFLTQQTYDAIIIASPNYLHLEHFLTVKNHQPTCLLIEKPIAINDAQLQEWEIASSDYPKPIWVGMEYRFMPPIAKLIELATSERIGEFAMLTICEHRFPFLNKVNDWNRFNKYSGGTLVEKCCHFFDLMCHILKSKPVRISAMSSQFHNHQDELYPEGKSDIWDHGYVMVEFADQKKALLELCMFAEGEHYQERISLVGTKGKLESFVPGPQRFWKQDKLGPAPIPKVIYSPRDRNGYEVIDAPVENTQLDAGDHNGATYYQHSSFLEVVKGRKNIAVSLADGLLSNRMGLLAQRSATEHRVIEF